MANHESTFEVAATPDVVAAYLADLTNRPAWDPTVVAVTPHDAADPGTSGARVVVGFYGRRLELDYVVERHDADCVVLQGAGKKLGRRDTFRIEPHDGGSRVTYRAELELKGMLRMLDRGLQVSIDSMVPRAVKGIEAALTG